MSTGTEADRIRDFVLSLPPTDRCVLLMHYVDGLTSSEIAIILHREEPDVRKLLNGMRRDADKALRNEALVGHSAP